MNPTVKSAVLVWLMVLLPSLPFDSQAAGCRLLAPCPWKACGSERSKGKNLDSVEELRGPTSDGPKFIQIAIAANVIGSPPRFGEPKLQLQMRCSRRPVKEVDVSSAFHLDNRDSGRGVHVQSVNLRRRQRMARRWQFGVQPIGKQPRLS
jgi:hypothetical protein